MPSLGRDIPGFYYNAEKNRYFPVNRMQGRPAGGRDASSTTLNATTMDETQSSRSLIPSQRAPTVGGSSGRHTHVHDIHSLRSSDWRRSAQCVTAPHQGIKDSPDYFSQNIMRQYAGTSHSKTTWSYPEYPTYQLRCFSVSH